MEQRESTFTRYRRPLVIIAAREERAFSPKTLHAIAQAATEHQWDLLDIRFTGGVVPRERTPSGGLIAALPTEPLALQLRKMNCPAVRLGFRPHPKDHLLPCVIPDRAAIGRLAAEHFAERGFEHVGFVARQQWEIGKVQFEAFRARAEQLGAQVHLLRLQQDIPEGGAAKHAQRVAQMVDWLRGLPKPIGVMTIADTHAAILCAQCRLAGLAVPEEVAVLGVGNSITCEMAPVPLSSIETADDVIVTTAAALLQRMMQGEEPEACTIRVPPSSVVARRSTDILAVKDPRVAAAMRFMWDHLDRPLSVTEVAEAVGMPRRSLERAFHDSLQRGVSEELRRKRLERCCEWLATTDLSIADIVPHVGFSSAEYLHATFKRFVGMTPRTYRISHR